jgi:hypothetical protein
VRDLSLEDRYRLISGAGNTQDFIDFLDAEAAHVGDLRQDLDENIDIASRQVIAKHLDSMIDRLRRTSNNLSTKPTSSVNDDA